MAKRKKICDSMYALNVRMRDEISELHDQYVRANPLKEEIDVFKVKAAIAPQLQAMAKKYGAESTRLRQMCQANGRCACSDLLKAQPRAVD
jgi:hypothetical protein